MKESTDTRYVYTISRIRVIEQKMLSPAMLERMIEAGTPEEALKVLHDAATVTQAKATVSVTMNGC